MGFFPVENKLGEIRAALAQGCDVVLTAPPGSGKTTCVAPALLREPWLDGKKILMLEPRRLAARNCATYMSKRLGETVGATIGYQVRLERRISKTTRLEVLTEGLLTQRIMADPELADVGLVIFDEFHERSLQCDLAYALALEVKRALRPDLRLMVMSATLDVDEVLASLSANAAQPPASIAAQGAMYPVETRYLGEVSMRAAIDRALHETTGDVLCFLPGEGEIRQLEQQLSNLADDRLAILPLFGSLPKDDQDRVFKPNSRRKIILATSIAETSVTIEGITTVIDSGLMRVPRFSPATGMSGLITLPLTLDRAEQRRGRAGRVQAGVCYRLWTSASEGSRPLRMLPEILDADLSALVLTCAAWGALKREELPWMTPPPASAWERAVQLLQSLGALNEQGGLTDKGREMARLPMHPRLANMVLGAHATSANDGAELPRAALLAAIIEEGSRTRESDIRYVAITSRMKQLAKNFARHCRTATRTDWRDSDGALLALAYPDRVAKNRGNGAFTMVSGRGAFLPGDDPLATEPYLICCELDDRQGDARIFLACPISEGEIESLFTEQISEVPSCEWDRRNERVKAVSQRRLGAMVLKEMPSDVRQLSEVAVMAMMQGIRLKGVEALPCWTRDTLQLRARIAFVGKHCWANEAIVANEALMAALPGFTEGMTKWRDLEKLDIAAVMDFLLASAGHDRRELDRLAPVRMEVPSGSHMIIHYEGDEPTVEVRLQECFGLMTTPKVAGGQLPIVMTLLSPAQRPCAVTKDLQNFWREGYPLVRKDLRGRYPKHYWPEDPLTAVATRRVRPR